MWRRSEVEEASRACRAHFMRHTTMEAQRYLSESSLYDIMSAHPEIDNDLDLPSEPVRRTPEALQDSTRAPVLGRDVATIESGEHGQARGARRELSMLTSLGTPLLFGADRQPNGMYRVTLTEEGLEAFETALGIARDLGRQTRISTYSTIADIMERTATREELSEVMRQEDACRTHAVRLHLLQRMLRGSEEPSRTGKILAHVGKMVIVGAFLVWTLIQFTTAIADIVAIPGILANIPSDILHLDPTAAISKVGDKIADAGTHVVYGVLGMCLTYIVAKLSTPFGRIYRRDQMVVGERFVLQAAVALVRRIERRRHGVPAPGG